MRLATGAAAGIRSFSPGDHSVFISTTLRHQLLGLEWTRNGQWNVYFGKLRIGTLAKRKGHLRFTPVEYIRLNSLHHDEADSAPAVDAG